MTMTTMKRTDRRNIEETSVRIRRGTHVDAGEDCFMDFLGGEKRLSATTIEHGFRGGSYDA
jgi:hypothetical protein